ncbi:TPA: hypothetical protein IVK59_002089 [Enterococcus faecium]|nr:hypothetical protein [Enterococcus faecium]HAP6464785.1 hypothetical protein [Enterococcus faecium]HAP6467797.1 hypothetical protein [Enterococcus faecium]HAP6470872.1 hypothetical protein [Enterococcus faecium]HAP6476775.1 hypothetical protein [Enterococcus faecium]
MKTNDKHLDKLISLKNRMKHKKISLNYITECINEIKKSSSDPSQFEVLYKNHYLAIVNITKEQVINVLNSEALELTIAILEIQDEIIELLEEK